jgi:hypothetical protein
MTAYLEVTMFLLIAACLGACLVSALWEIERGREHRNRRSADQVFVLKTVIQREMENKVPSPKQAQANDFTCFIAYGVICIILLALVGWQPNAAIQIGETVEAEASMTTAGEPSGRSVAEPMSRPMQPTAWSQVIDSRKLVPGK